MNTTLFSLESLVVVVVVVVGTASLFQRHIFDRRLIYYSHSDRGERSCC